MTLSRRVARSLAALRERELPPEVAQAAALHFIDATGTALAAAGVSMGEAYRRYAANLPDGGRASLLARTGGTSASSAALVNGGLCHSLEYDDTHTGSIIHASAVLMPAALAVAEEVGASPAQMLGAYVRGYEFLVRVGRAAPGGFQKKGFQVTPVAGVMASALIAAELHGLDEDATVAAIGIALSQGSGVFEFLSNGSSVKSLHPGWAAHAGIIAAEFAKAGMTGPETAIEGKRGLFNVFVGDSAAIDRFAAELDDLGAVWRISEAAFKFSPCCHYLHPFIEALGLLAERGVTVDAVESLVCEVPLGADAVICEPWADKLAAPTGHSGRWSLPIVVASQLVEGRVDLETFERPASAEVRALAQRVSWRPLENADFPNRFEAVVICKTKDGASRTIRVEDAYGNHTRPPAPEEVLAKFRTNAAKSLTPDAAEALEIALRDMQGVPDLSRVTAALRAERRPCEGVSRS
ncbi:MAG: MmgE/PrpD family protein [Salinarimonadaceae bacterium]|nr:MAG: MmgE/PrpD family protein [Salinarimonadaceae bacterium]